MKKKVIIGLTVSSVLLLLGGLYLLLIIERATGKLDNLIGLHQVEILREHYLVQVGRVQTDLALRDTPYSREFGTVVSNVMKMSRVVEACSSCHHVESVDERIRSLQAHTEDYTDALSRVLTVRAGTERLSAEKDAAFEVGETLISRANDMIAASAARLEATTRESLRAIDRSKYVLYALIGIAPFVSAALGFVFISGLTSPVKVLLDSTKKIKGGDLDHRVTDLKHEFGQLADAFNDMAFSLKEQMQKMQRTEQMVVLGELSAALAHEIKNPLAGIKVAMDVLANEADLSEEDRGVVGKVGEEVSRLESLMKSFLNFARPPKPQFASINVNTLLNTALSFCAGARKMSNGGDAQVEVVKQFDDLPSAVADPMQLQQVFLNLMINAVDAMPDGGRLGVQTTFDEKTGEIDIGITDTGEGIDPAFAEKIFQPFFTTKHGGTGLGLAISRQLIEQHGGSIEATGLPAGGTRFTIRLPLLAAGYEGEADA